MEILDFRCGTPVRSMEIIDFRCGTPVPLPRLVLAAAASAGEAGTRLAALAPLALDRTWLDGG